MQTIDIHEAKTHLSRLVERGARGESFVIAMAGRPMVKIVPLVPLNTPMLGPCKRIGFLVDQIQVPDDFDTMASKDIEQLFGTGE